MDGVPRFENPKLLRAGRLNKAAMQNDTAPSKSMPPFILDRFRDMVSEREEELRVSGDDAVSPLSTDEIVRLYEIVLSELTLNSKPIITDLTIIAGEQRAHGEGIADAICARIIEAPVDKKLRSLYLLDSIVKNIGSDYVKYFSARLPEVFHEAYKQGHPNMHPVMSRLFDTWSAVFPASLLRKIEPQLQIYPSVNHQSSGLTALRVPDSPLAAHGIHVNPKYLEAQHLFGRPSVGAEGKSSTGRAGHTKTDPDSVNQLPSSATRVNRSSPYGIGHGRSLSPLVDEFDADSHCRRASERASPSHSGFGYGLNRVTGRDEEASEGKERTWHDGSNQQHKNSAAYSYNSGVDLRGPRALIDAYGIDEREKNLNLRRPKVEQWDVNGVEKASIKTWQNAEEEEFDWEDMSPTLGDQSRRNKLHSSYVSLSGNLKAKHSFVAYRAAPLAADYRSSWSKTQFSSATDSSVVEDVPSTNPGHGIINKNTELRKATSQITASSSARESWNSPQHLNFKGGSSYSGTGSFSSAGEAKPTVMGNFWHVDEKLYIPPDVVSRTSSTSFDSPSPEILSTHAPVLAKAWLPPKLRSSYPLPSVAALPLQMQIRGQFGVTNAGNVIADPGLHMPIHSKKHLGGTNSMRQSELPHFPIQRPGPVPLNLHRFTQTSLAQPDLLMSQVVRQNLSLPSLAPGPSHAILQPLSHGYSAQARGPSIDTALHNMIPYGQSALPVINAPNTSIHLAGASLPSLPQRSLLDTTQSLPIPQNIGQVAPSHPAGSALSGLISSLVAQGLISLKKQDSVGVEFDQDFLKVRHESAITSLYADLPRQCKTCGLRFKDQEEHSKHMDWHVNKNRTLRNRKTKRSPNWFVNISMWLRGAEALGTEAVPGFLPAESIVERKEDEEMVLPADENQTVCALCGETFDDFYSDEMEEWMYRGAVYMNAPAGLTAGMDRSQLGPIVHAKCISDSHVIPSEDFTRAVVELTEEGIQRKKMKR